MKFKKIILLFSLISLISSYAQKGSISEFSNVDVILNDGKIINGKLNFPISINQKEIFLKSKKNKSQKLKLTDVISIAYNTPKDTLKFEKVVIIGEEISKKTEDIQFLQLINKGGVNLYYGYNTGFIFTQNKKEKYIQKTNLLFCKRKNEKTATLVYFQNDIDDNENNLKKIALDYFSKDKVFKERLITAKKYNSEFLINYIKTYNNENQLP